MSERLSQPDKLRIWDKEVGAARQRGMPPPFVDGSARDKQALESSVQRAE